MAGNHELRTLVTLLFTLVTLHACSLAKKMYSQRSTATAPSRMARFVTGVTGVTRVTRHKLPARLPTRKFSLDR